MEFFFHGFLIQWISYSMDFLFHGFLIPWISYSMDFLFHGFLIPWISYSMDFLFHGFLSHSLSSGLSYLKLWILLFPIINISEIKSALLNRMNLSYDDELPTRLLLVHNWTFDSKLKIKEESMIQRNWVVVINSNLLIPLILQPEGVNLWYFKLIKYLI